ncbi:hypothetical protein P171DRAFT_504544 [Karstenula rhodostoma CBS 690.94]|uniref:Extracellular membrane protein CFEM domain-containing protein n=1 Tax=Karstenula rhodostoma CBS 690.94 TaxID=1392251 RepID=A0A9P4P7P3_9PLEO|nr:hypothetical protein P171DRAFT_504544 [Karstenula rhodostoma CBS 690.94]
MRHSRNWVFFCFFIFALTTQAQRFFSPKISPKEPKPVEVQPRPPKPPKEDPPVAEQNGGKPAEPAAKPPTPSPGPIQTNMARLEQKVASEVMSEVVSQLAEGLASALLGTATESADAPTITTTSMDMSSYQPCINYASKISSCAAATSGFYSTDDLAAQASCVCYTSSSSCAATTYITAFDDYAYDCQDYLSFEGGYTSVADAMMDGEFYLGPFFCDWVSSEVAYSYTTDGLPATLDPTTCASATRSSETGPVEAEETGAAAALPTPADDGILATAAAIVAVLTGYLIV